MPRTRLTSALSLRHPVVSAPMIRASDARLAAAVSAAGGLRLVGGDYGNPDWLAGQIKALGPRQGQSRRRLPPARGGGQPR